MANQPFVPVAKVIRVTIQGTFRGGPWLNGFHVQYSGATPTTGDMNILADAISTAWNTAVAPIHHIDKIVTQTKAWDLTSPQGAVGVSTAQHPGTLAGASQALNHDAVVVTWPVQDRWRGGHFRTYDTLRNYADLTDGRSLLTATITAYKNAWQAFLVAVNALTLTSGTVTLGGVRYFPTGFDANGNPIVKTSGQFRAFQNPTVHTRVDSQRRRSGKEIV